MSKDDTGKSLAIPVAVGLAVGILVIAVVSIVYSMPAPGNRSAGGSMHNVLDRYQTPSEANAGYPLYIYLFKVDSSLQNETLLGKLPALYGKVQNMTGISRPSQQAMLYTATKGGIYDPSGSLVRQLGPAKIIVSNDITMPDGTRVTESAIANNATFYILPIAPLLLIEEDSGQLYAYHVVYYPNPKHIGGDRTVTTIEFAVAGSDYEKFDSQYGKIKSMVESLK
ncbi:MAG: hypothetical protein ABI361_13495 [Nitrososphaera sp.]|jgi:hypothetical protein